MPVDQIKVGERHRKDMGDIAGLAANIAAVGLLHPIVVQPDGTLIAGERRLQAAQLLGWKTIPVTVIDLDDIVRGEFAENTHRKDFTLSEAVAIKRALEPLEKAAAKERSAQVNPWASCPRVRAAPPTRPPRRRAWHAVRWRRPRPSSMPPRPSPSASASCSPTWTAPAVPMVPSSGCA